MSNIIPEDLKELFRDSLMKYDRISVREKTTAATISKFIGRNVEFVLDPTLLLCSDEWNKIATPKRIVKKKYILCYFLNYTFNAFPYVEELAQYIQKQTGYDIVRIARPPYHIHTPHTTFNIGASPEDFLALIRDAEIILTTSFHGTAFAINYGRPVFSIVEDRNAIDSRQVSLMHLLGLENQILSIKDKFPEKELFTYNIEISQNKLRKLRDSSIEYLKNALDNA